MKHKNEFSFLIQKEINTPHGKRVDIKDIDNVANMISANNYSGGIYSGNKRSLNNWKKSCPFDKLAQL